MQGYEEANHKSISQRLACQLPEDDAVGEAYGFSYVGTSGHFHRADGKHRFGGTDTTAIAMTAILYQLLKHPHYLLRVQEEIDRAVNAGQLSYPNITYNEASRLRFFDACCKEGLRIHASIAFPLIRVVPPGGLHLEGSFLPAGTKISINLGTVQQSELAFGLDASVFRPERWLEPGNGSQDLRSGMMWFGAGKRICAGQHVSEQYCISVFGRD